MKRELKTGYAYAVASEDVTLTITPKKGSRRRVRTVLIRGIHTLPAGCKGIWDLPHFRLREDDKMSVRIAHAQDVGLHILYVHPDGHLANVQPDP